MIKKVILQNFKCFENQEFNIKNNIILAGPNNSGKTTLIQAIATWHFALNQWLEGKGSSKAKKFPSIPITRSEFRTMPVRELNFLWTNTSTALKKSEGPPGAPRVMLITIEGENEKQEPWDVTMEFRYSNSKLLYVKPSKEPELEKMSELIVHVPSFSGISTEEPIRTPELQEWLIGTGKPGDIIRNLLADIFDQNKQQWEELNQEIEDIFACRLLEPKFEGRPFILCDYQHVDPSKQGVKPFKLDIANAGSGFLQTVMLLAFFYARRATVFLMDEPDTHLHVILQGQIYDRLRDLARKNYSQLIIATHSEVLVNNTDSDKIVSFYGRPHILLNNTGRDAVSEALKRLSTMDIALSEEKSILYIEGENDFKILHAWAKVLEHPVYQWFSRKKCLHLQDARQKTKRSKKSLFCTACDP